MAHKDLLITGGFGFVGTHLVEELIQHGPEKQIHIVDNLSTSVLDHPDFLDSINNGNVTYDIANITDYLDTTTDEFDQVYHLASVVGPAGVLPHAGTIAKSIIEDADTIARKSKDWNARLLDVSTSELYGGGTSTESDHKIISPDASARLEYAVGKLAAEVSLINRANIADQEIVIVRPFNIAGARQSKVGGFVIPRFVEQAIDNQPLTVFGNGSQIRAFTHVKDMATGLRLAMAGGRSGEAYNIGDGRNKTTILSLARHVIDLVGSDSEVGLVDPKEIYGEFYTEANDKLPDSTKAANELGWRPNRTLKEIILDALNWQRTLQ